MRRFRVLLSKVTQWLEETVLADVNTSTNMTEISGQYNKFLAEHGIHEPIIKSYIVKRRLAMHFGDRLQFHRPSSRRLENQN